MHRPYHSLPCSSHMTRSWRIEDPLNSSLSTESIDPLLIPFFNCFSQLLVPFSEVCSTVAPNFPGVSSEANDHALIMESVFKATSMCMAWTVRHVKIHPCLLTLLLPCFTSIGPRKSTSTYVKGGLWG